MTTRKCITKNCDNRTEPPARKCKQCKRATRKAARRRSAGSRTFTKPVAARVLAYTSPASSQIAGNADFYRDRAARKADDDCAWCGGPHRTDPDEIEILEDAQQTQRELLAVASIDAIRRGYVRAMEDSEV